MQFQAKRQTTFVKIPSRVNQLVSGSVREKGYLWKAVQAYPKSMIGAGVREIDDQLKWFVAEGLQRENDMVDQ